MTIERIVTTRHLAGLESALTSASRVLLSTYPEAGRERCHGEPREVAVVRALVEDCDHLLAALDDYRSHLVVDRSRNPDQLGWPF
jgi:ABC-type transport system involved in cytochrome bd biosynthesis fused ATPase/permease subunit